MFRLSFSILLIAMLVSPNARLLAQWSGASVDTLTHNSLRDEIRQQSLDVDNAGTVHAVWMTAVQGSGWSIWYAQQPAGGSWSAAREVASPGFGTQPAMAVDKATGICYVAFIVPTALSDEIFVAKDSAGSFIQTRVTYDLVNDISPTIAVDGNGWVHLASITDTLGTYKIRYATNLSGQWEVQQLDSSELGPFGSGAEPFISVTSDGRTHVTYRGGDFGTYRIHHAWNTKPGGREWNYEIVPTPNGNDFTSSTVVTSDSTLHLIASGNDGFGFPPRVYYLTKPPGGSWTVPQLANVGGNGWGGSLFIDQHGNSHITWNETSGNIYTGDLYYATNKSGSWSSLPILADGATYNGVLVLGQDGRGTALAYNGNTFETQEIIALRSTAPLTDVEETFSPSEFKLFQNYPNPFNPRTNIRFKVPTRSVGRQGSGVVTLKVFDVLGREVATLVNEVYPVNGVKEPGTYEVTWDASGVASGVYFYKMRAQGFEQTNRMILLR